MVEIIFLDILYGVTTNWALVISGIIAIIQARRGKRPWGWFVAGSVFQALGCLGGILGMLRDPKVWVTENNIIGFISTAVLFFVFLYFIKRFSKMHQEKKDEE